MGSAEMDIPETEISGQSQRPRPRSVEDDDEESTPEIVRTMKLVGEDDVKSNNNYSYSSYNDKNDDNVVYVGNEEKPSKGEIFSCHTVPPPQHLWSPIHRDGGCSIKELQIYTTVTNRIIKIGGAKFSPLDWISFSWGIGLILVAPLLGILSVHLDFGRNQQLVAAAATGAGALFCLPAGFFRTRWIFPPYIVVIVAANTISNSSHARHLGLMVRGLVGNSIRQRHFPDRRSVASWLSLHATAAGCLGAAAISAFTYHMLRNSDGFTSLWVVSIFSGLIWVLGMAHIFGSNRPGNTPAPIDEPTRKAHMISIFKYPHAAGSLAGVFLSSFVTMCIFAGAVLYAIGDLCVEAPILLYLWLTYFIFPILSLPLTHPIQVIQQLMKLDAVKMQLLGFLLSVLTSGFGFYYRRAKWSSGHLLLFAAIQSTGTGFLHAFGRVLLLDCAPAGKEGAFSVWFSWVRALGSCAGYALASAFPGNISKSFGTAFCAACLGMIILIFGNISSFGGAKAAGNVREYSEKGSPVAAVVEDDNVKAHAGGKTEV
nr:putative major facilitator superfamily domain-containing protein [Ipomoea batatas]